MNQEDQRKINDFMRSLDISHVSRSKPNNIVIHPRESKDHFMAKCIECFKIYQAGRPFFTEAYTNDQRRRYDILDPLNPDGECRIEITFLGEDHTDCDKVILV